MPVENLEEEGLPKNPNLEIAQWRYTLTAPHGDNKEEIATRLLDAIKENSTFEYNNVSLFCTCEHLTPCFCLSVSKTGFQYPETFKLIGSSREINI